MNYQREFLHFLNTFPSILSKNSTVYPRSMRSMSTFHSSPAEWNRLPSIFHGNKHGVRSTFQFHITEQKPSK